MESELKSLMMSKADPPKVAGLSRFFKCGPGQYGDGDVFLGIKVPDTRAIVRDCWIRTAPSSTILPAMEGQYGSDASE